MATETKTETKVHRTKQQEGGVLKHVTIKKLAKIVGLVVKVQVKVLGNGKTVGKVTLKVMVTHKELIAKSANLMFGVMAENVIIFIIQVTTNVKVIVK